MVPFIFQFYIIFLFIIKSTETIRKSIVQATELHATSGSDLHAQNQLTRWILTKEEHAQKIITLVANDCLCQRVKAEIFDTDEEYVQALKLHHAVMQCAVKTKQQVNTAACDALDHAIADMAEMYTHCGHGENVHQVKRNRRK